MQARSMAPAQAANFSQHGCVVGPPQMTPVPASTGALPGATDIVMWAAWGTISARMSGRVTATACACVGMSPESRTHGAATGEPACTPPSAAAPSTSIVTLSPSGSCAAKNSLGWNTSVTWSALFLLYKGGTLRRRGRAGCRRCCGCSPAAGRRPTWRAAPAGWPGQGRCRQTARSCPPGQFSGSHPGAALGQGPRAWGLHWPLPGRCWATTPYAWAGSRLPWSSLSSCLTPGWPLYGGHSTRVPTELHGTADCRARSSWARPERARQSGPLSNRARHAQQLTGLATRNDQASATCQLSREDPSSRTLQVRAGILLQAARLPTTSRGCHRARRRALRTYAAGQRTLASPWASGSLTLPQHQAAQAQPGSQSWRSSPGTGSSLPGLDRAQAPATPGRRPCAACTLAAWPRGPGRGTSAP